MMQFSKKVGIALLLTCATFPSAGMAQSSSGYWGAQSASSQPGGATGADCPESVAAVMNQQTRQAVDQYGSLAQTLYDELQQAKYAEQACLKNLLNQHPTLSGLGIPSLSSLLQQFESAACNALQTNVNSLESMVQTATQRNTNGYEIMPGVSVGQSSSAITFASGTTPEQSDAAFGVNQANQALSLLSNAAKYPVNSMISSFSDYTHQ